MQIIRSFETCQRYYKLILTQDLLDDWIVIACWGGKTNNQGNHKTLVVQNAKEGLVLMAELAVERFKRRYWEIFRPVEPILQVKQILALQANRVSVAKKSDALDPKKYIRMITHIQQKQPQLFCDKNLSMHSVVIQIRTQFPEYTVNEINALFKQWKATPFFIGTSALSTQFSSQHKQQKSRLMSAGY